MIFTLQHYYTDVMDEKLNELRKDYDLRIHGFSASGRYVYALVEISQKFGYEVTGDDGVIFSVNEGKPLPDDPGQFSVD
jgi:hypothetical protein